MSNKTIEITYTLYQRPMIFCTLFSAYSDPSTQFQQACYTLKQLTQKHQNSVAISTNYYSSKENQIREMLHLINLIGLLSTVDIQRVVCHHHNLTTILYDQRRSYYSKQAAHPHLRHYGYESGHH